MAGEERVEIASHDLPVSPALAEFMRRGWIEPADADLQPADVAPYCAKRRAAVGERFPGRALVVPSGTPKARSGDTDFHFRPASDFVWLTGAQEPWAVLVMEPEVAGHRATLFLRGRGARSEPDFYRNRLHGELWVGRRRSLAEWERVLGIECRELAGLEAALRRLDPAATAVLRGVDPAVDAAVDPGDRPADAELLTQLDELRLVKDEWEIGQLELAVELTRLGFDDIVRTLPKAQAEGERWVDAVFGMRARAGGNGTGYPTIAAAGSHATSLHWSHNDGPVRAGELLLVDAGVETRTLYTADITRTLPISGRFTDTQRRVYDLVLAAQQAAIEAVRPGAPFRAYTAAAMAVLAAGLEDWGLLPEPAEASLRPESGLHRRYTLHSSGHMLGLDVHDCANARAAAYLDGVLEPGNVLTVEPGLYLQPDDATVPEELRGVGVRIEDDVLVTPDGCRVLSAAIPRTAADVEAWTAELRTG